MYIYIYLFIFSCSDLILLFLEEGADLHLHSNGSTPLMLACSSGQEHLIQMLIKHGGARVDQRSTTGGKTALMKVKKKKKKNVIRFANFADKNQVLFDTFFVCLFIICCCFLPRARPWVKQDVSEPCCCLVQTKS